MFNDGNGTSESLNVLDLNESNMNCLSFGMFEAVGGNGIFFGRGGGRVRFNCGTVSADATVAVGWGIGKGKHEGRMFMSMQARLLKYSLSTCSQK